ncbi:MAG: thioredoxin domain-containing protein, partial [Candidatus Omnitrophica bacterium]|nr:thioredoxin domain-containing protein [Candidatus Omnitrophota bacterium]
LGLCAYLEFLHLALMRGELLGGAACGAAGTIFNCHAVTASPFGEIFGLPLALWGLIGYLVALSLSLIAWQFPEHASTALASLVFLTIGFVMADVALLIVMVTKVHYLCPLCLVTYGVNLSLLGVAAFATAQPWHRVIAQAPAVAGEWIPRRGREAAWMLWTVMLTGAAGVVALNLATTFMLEGAPGTMRKQMAQFVSQQRRVQVETGHSPTKGSAAPTVQLVEFSDFLCPSCQRASKLNPILLAAHHQDVALVFKFFPLDTECNTAITRQIHPTACQLAAAAACAHEQGKFWALHDRIFERMPNYKITDVERDAAKIGLDLPAFQGCLQSGRGLEAVKRDIADASRIGITSTPTYIINGVPMTGVMTPAIFKEFLDALRQSAS